MLDSTYQHCSKPMTVTPSILTYAYPADWGNNKAYVLSLTSCDNRAFTITTVKTSGGITASGYTPFTQTFYIGRAISDLDNWIGSINLRAEYISDSGATYFEPFRVNFIRTDLVKNTQTPDHDISLCPETPYPLFYGNTYSYRALSMEIDQWGNFLLAGAATGLPYGMSASGTLPTHAGFIQLLD